MKPFIMRIVAFLFLSATVSAAVDPNTVVAHFGDVPIYAEEVTFHIRDQVALVAVHFKTRHQADLSGDNWLQYYEDEVPLELLMERSLESCRRSKAIQVLALKHELAEQLPFPGFGNVCEQINAARAKGRTEGRVLYGPLAYSPAQLYKYKLTNMQNHLKTFLADVESQGRDALQEETIQEQMMNMPVTLEKQTLNQLIAEQVGASTSLRSDLGEP
ncbi:hypothetical protein P4C99_04010 [Pontiellaceae bacterium B1224]|nr:hypothetical protein [Pontiellaceae bacterium B1224]